MLLQCRGGSVANFRAARFPEKCKVERKNQANAAFSHTMKKRGLFRVTELWSRAEHNGVIDFFPLHPGPEVCKHGRKKAMKRAGDDRSLRNLPLFALGNIVSRLE